MKNNKKSSLIIILITIALLALLLINLIPLPPFCFSAWLTYFDFKDSFQTYKDNAGFFAEINPFIYYFHEDGSVVRAESFSDKDLNDIRQIARSNNTKLIPTVVNDVIPDKDSSSEGILKDSNIIHLILQDNLSIARHTSELSSLVKANDLDGIEIDYENIKAEDKDGLIKFLKLLSREMHKENKQLNLVLESRALLDKKPLFNSDDLSLVSGYVDLIKIMCYPLHGSFSGPGPVSSISLIKKILSCAKAQIPKEKLNIALALHGFDWSQDTISRMNFQEAKELAQKHNARIMRNKDKTPYFSYFQEKAQHTVWFEDAKSFKAKLQVISRYGITKISLWRLESNSKEVYQGINRIKTYTQGLP